MWILFQQTPASLICAGYAEPVALVPDRVTAYNVARTYGDAIGYPISFLYWPLSYYMERNKHE